MMPRRGEYCQASLERSGLCTFGSANGNEQLVRRRRGGFSRVHDGVVTRRIEKFRVGLSEADFGNADIRGASPRIGLIEHQIKSQLRGVPQFPDDIESPIVSDRSRGNGSRLSSANRIQTGDGLMAEILDLRIGCSRSRRRTGSLDRRRRCKVAINLASMHLGKAQILLVRSEVAEFKLHDGRLSLVSVRREPSALLKNPPGAIARDSPVILDRGSCAVRHISCPHGGHCRGERRIRNRRDENGNEHRPYAALLCRSHSLRILSVSGLNGQSGKAGEKREEPKGLHGAPSKNRADYAKFPSAAHMICVYAVQIFRRCNSPEISLNGDSKYRLPYALADSTVPGV